MPYKVVVVFRLLPGQADAEIARCRSEHSLVNLLRQEPGFVAYEVVKLGEDKTMVVQTWETKAHLKRAIPKAAAARARLTGVQESLVVSGKTFAGEVALASG